MLLYGSPSAITQSLCLRYRNSKSSGNSNRSSSSIKVIMSMATDRTSIGTASITAPQRRARNNISPLESRVSLILALASQISSLSQRHLATETAKYVFPRRFEARNLEEALMSGPDLETVKFKVLSRKDKYEIGQVEVVTVNQPYFIAETTMPGKYGFDFNEHLDHSMYWLNTSLNTTEEKMEMTTPVLTLRTQSEGEKMDMTTPVITRRLEDQDKWQMSFVMPSKDGSNLPLPKDPSVTIKEIPKKIVAVVAFSGFVTDEEVKQRESVLRNALKNDSEFQVKAGASVEVAQYNPPFTLPFARCNEISLEVERKQE